MGDHDRKTRGAGLSGACGVRSIRKSAWRTALCFAAAQVLAGSHAARAQSLEDLSHLSIEDLGNVEITSVSKVPQRLSDAPAAIYVITHDDIVRSGASRIPEMLRLAPNLYVAQVNANTYAISARGFNGASPNGPVSNKLLVLIDGRSVYTPIYSGVYWDAPDVPAEDIDRIEVISGPGGTLWGANAVNGVINIITRKSSDTQGGVTTVYGGNLGREGTVQYGGRVNDTMTYRIYGDSYAVSNSRLQSGSSAQDSWYKSQSGFRFDWTPTSDMVTVQGDTFAGQEQVLGNSNTFISGANLLARWNHRFDGGSAAQIQTYYDQTRRYTVDGGGGFSVETFDVDIQHNIELNSWNALVWGAGERVNYYRITNIASIQFIPDSRALNLANAFAEDTISITDKIKLIPGIKLEDDPYVGIQPLPSIRASWKVTDNDLIWGAVSRAVRAPTPFDTEINEIVGTTKFLTGSEDFQSEKLIAYELGYRGESGLNLSYSASLFWNEYDDLRSVELNPSTGFLPLIWGNEMEGNTYGAEFWGNYRVNDWWRLMAGLTIQHENLRFKDGASGLGGVQLAGNDPTHQATLRSTFNLSQTVTLETDLREAGALPNPAVSSYVELNSRIAWTPRPFLEIALSGFNLLHAHHLEFTNAPNTTEVGRSVMASMQVRF